MILEWPLQHGRLHRSVPATCSYQIINLRVLQHCLFKVHHHLRYDLYWYHESLNLLLLNHFLHLLFHITNKR